MNYIYCYTNKINGKRYVGQTNNEQRRVREHKSNYSNPKSVNYNNIIHKAMRKYGYENFTYELLEVVEGTQDLVDDREAYWIDVLGSRVNKNGYNILEGGNGNSWRSIFKPEEVADIKAMIKRQTPYDAIVEKYGISKTFISDINRGKHFFDPDSDYPLCKSYRLEQDKLDILVEMLQASELNFREIAEELGIAQSTVKKINYGTLRNGLVDNYPIRKITPADRKAEIAIDLLPDITLSKREIMEQAGISEETLRKINIGARHRKENLDYPLRSFVETIRS